MKTLVTLTTDFGLADEYAGVMKGVILSIAPFAQIVDISHGIATQDILEAAYVIDAAYGYFPRGTIHVVVVDPGVGGKRRICVLCADNHMFIAPDNGVLSLLLTEDRFEAAYEVGNSDLFLKTISNTFHGRDIMAPVAAHLASGLPVHEVGRKLSFNMLYRALLPQVTINRKQKVIQGEIITCDTFGNLTTNIKKDAIMSLTDAGSQPDIVVSIKGRTLHGLDTSYDSVPAGMPVAVIGSRNYLEIAANQDNAARLLQVGPGEKVEIMVFNRRSSLDSES